MSEDKYNSKLVDLENLIYFSWINWVIQIWLTESKNIRGVWFKKKIDMQWNLKADLEYL